MRPLSRLALVMLLLAGGALALEYRVDAGGGPAGLAEAVQQAFASWAEVEGAQVEAEMSQSAPNLIRYGDATELGPDVVTLTLSEGSGQDAGLTVLVNPEAQELLRPALLHETGLLLGLNSAQTGVMNPALSTESPAELTEEDRAALMAQATSAPEDINQDGVVNFYDLAALAENYGRTGVNLAADINGDGVVDDQDLALLREAYVFSPPAETPPVTESPTPEQPAEETLPEVPETGAPVEEPLDEGVDETPGAEDDVPEGEPGTEEEQGAPADEPREEEPDEQPPEPDEPAETDEEAPAGPDEPETPNDAGAPETPDQPGDETP